MIPTGTQILVGMYDMKGNYITSYRTEDGTVEIHEDMYRFKLTHDVSKKIVGKVTLEITMHNADNSIVEHADEVLTLSFEPRRNNSLL